MEPYQGPSCNKISSFRSKQSDSWSRSNADFVDFGPMTFNWSETEENTSVRVQNTNCVHGNILVKKLLFLYHCVDIKCMFSKYMGQFLFLKQTCLWADVGSRENMQPYRER